MELKPAGAADLAFQKAEAALTQKGRTFHWARRLMGALHASRATRLYSFCRLIDDLADDATTPESGKSALLLAAEDVARGASLHPVIQDGINLMRECGIERAVVLELISGVASDLTLVQMVDEDALLRYCYQVAGTVGLMMCKVLDTKNHAALPHAVDLGIAMQLTNICRDVAVDASVGRRYLPASLVGPLEPKLLVYPALSLQPGVRKCIETLLDIADQYYRSGELGLSYLPVGARSGILTAARVYRAIGSRLRQQDSTYWLGRIVVPPGTKMRVTAQALVAVPFKPSFWTPSQRHDARLHRALSGFFGFGTHLNPQHVQRF
jgi:phytoene synthase